MPDTYEQTHYLYETLKTLVQEGDVAATHVLKRLPVDPFSNGQTTGEYRAVKELASSCGMWAVKLRQLYYGYCQSGYRKQSLHTGIAYATMYDGNLRTLLRSHERDTDLFPSVFVPDTHAEMTFKRKIAALDAIQEER